MLRQNQPRVSLSQQFVVTVMSVSITTFLLGGFVTYWGLKKLDALAGEAVGGDSKGPLAKRQGPQAQLVRVGKIERKKIAPVKTLIGDLVALRKVIIAAEVSGKVVELPVDEGTKVVGGQTLLARIDNTWTDLEAAKIETQIAEKQATLKYENDERKRFEQLLQNNAVSVSEVELKQSLIEELQASLAQLEVLLKEARERQSRIELIAPFDGSVVAKHTELGAYVSLGSQVVEIISSGRIDARIMVPEGSLPLLDVGDSVDLIVDSLGMELQGKVFSINAQGSVGSRTFPVRIELDDQGGKLMPGMGVSVFVPVMRESTELLVPRDAVLIQPDEATIWILLPDDIEGAPTGQPPTFVAHPVPIKVLSHARDSYAIACLRDADIDRVAPGVFVVTEGLERLIAGAKVRVDDDTTELMPLPGSYRTGQQIGN